MGIGVLQPQVLNFDPSQLREFGKGTSKGGIGVVQKANGTFQKKKEAIEENWRRLVFVPDTSIKAQC